MSKYIKLLSFIFIVFLLNGCVINGKYGIPNGGAAVRFDKPIWLSGIQDDELGYTQNFPVSVENDFMKIIQGGYWLANTNGKNSQLVYSFQINIKQPFSKNRVWTKTILENPSDKMNPIEYTHYLDEQDKNTQVTHAVVNNVKLHEKYHFTIEVYEDEQRTKLISSLKQIFISPVDNTTGCIQLDKNLKKALLGYMVDGKKVLSLDHLIVWCDVDATKYISEFGVDYLKDKPFPTVFFQDAMIFDKNQSWELSQKIAKMINSPVGRINIATGDYLASESLTTEDVLLNRTYEYINQKLQQEDKKGVLILFMTANNQFVRALKVAKLNNVKYENLKIMYFANDWSIEQRIGSFEQSQQSGIHPAEVFFDNQDLIEEIKNAIQ
ncbi:hypothetical protein [Arcobacter sp. FWKO B]|uniref:hypothetical protein n=1 Tax=Arcobacter sp. FWKO B TaxID=2593672 RepID=UPI0018A427D1|nr:hypothetical protein [Arcobacter sp. FWKO B]QOG12454.1 hypothetical protein FWKOB_06955 [Arcobacter sp. FWKO B]